MPKIPVTKTTSSGHQQRYWINPEGEGAKARTIPQAALSSSAERPAIVPRTTKKSALFERGTRWQNLPDGRLKELIESEMCDLLGNEYNSYDDFYDYHDGTVEVDIYGQAATLTLRLIDQEAVGMFRYGQCAVLAYALHELTGAPIVVFSDPDSDDWRGHAGLLTDNGQVLDIAGIHTFDEVKDAYSKVHEAPRVVDANEFLSIVKPDGAGFDDLGEMERLIILDFAEHVLREHVEGY